MAQAKLVHARHHMRWLAAETQRFIQKTPLHAAARAAPELGPHWLRFDLIVQQTRQVVRDQCTCPPLPAVIGAKSRDEISVDGATYQIVGMPRTFADLAGNPFKVTVVCEQQKGSRELLIGFLAR